MKSRESNRKELKGSSLVDILVNHKSERRKKTKIWQKQITPDTTQNITGRKKARESQTPSRNYTKPQVTKTLVAERTPAPSPQG